MYLRTIQRRNTDGGVVRYIQLAHNLRPPGSKHPVAHVVHSFGREDQLDRAALERLARSILRYLDDTTTPRRAPDPLPNLTGGHDVRRNLARPAPTTPHNPLSSPPPLPLQ